MLANDEESEYTLAGIIAREREEDCSREYNRCREDRRECR